MLIRPAAAALALTALFVSSAPSANAEIDYGVGSGAQVAALPGAFGAAQWTTGFLQGKPCAAPNTCVPISYFNAGDFFGAGIGTRSLDDGEHKLDDWIRSTPGKKIAMGHSLGALVIYKWLRDHSSDPTAPSPGELSFITLGAPERAGTGYAYSDPNGMFAYRKDQGLGLPANTPYKVVDVCRQWDGWCDWVPGDDRSKKGQTVLHIDYNNIDINDPANQVTVTGNITEIMVPTPGW